MGGSTRHVIAGRRIGLLATTALQAAGAAMLLAAPVAAQPAPTARPQGGSVVAGQAGISQTTAQTTVAQSSQRAAIDWNSFDIGAGHAVVYRQPNTSSITLNRVTGPDPSQIAGRIQANGQIVIVNRSGVVFSAGSQVDVQSLVVSTANVSTSNFMAGRLAFDQPGRPDAKISNAGTISVKAAGLAALVAPQVANSGTITARMGHVVLAGGEAHTVDLYGDGLMSVDVTQQVRHAPGGAVALVTNSGTIQADGGTIVLTAKAADGIITNLVSTTGRLQAHSVGDTPGSITVSAIGGSLSIAGSVRADGHRGGETGGTVTVQATDTVAIAPAARISANGRAGGGVIALGTTTARALAQGGGIPSGSARAVTVAAGARISADGRGTGSGGTVSLLSTDRTDMAGTITARGGAQGGDGGQIEVSGRTGFNISGQIDARAPNGQTGTLTIDPTILIIGNVGRDSPPNPAADGTGAPALQQNITAATFNAFGAVVRLTAGDITIGDNVRVLGTQAGSVSLNATGTLLVTGLGLVQPGPLSLSAGTILNIQAPVTTTSTLTLIGGSITQGAAGLLTAPALTGFATGAVTLGQSGNAVTFLGPFASAGAFTFTDTPGVGGLTIVGTVGPQVSMYQTNAPQPITLNVLGPNGSLTIGAGESFGMLSGSAVTLNTSGPISESNGTVRADLLTGVTTGTVTLTQTANDIATLGPFSATGAFSLTDTPLKGNLTIAGTVRAGLGSDPLTAAAPNAQPLALRILNASGSPTTGSVGALAVSGSLTIGTATTAGVLAGSVVTLNTDAGITEPNGSVVAAQLTGTAGGAVTLTQSSNNFLVLGPFASPGPLSFTDTPDAGGLMIAGLVRAGLASDPLSASAANAQSLTLTVLGGNGSLAIGTTTSPGISAGGIATSPGLLASGTTTISGILAGGAVSLSASGAISEPAGAVVAATLSGSAASLSLPAATDGIQGGQGNQIATLAAFSTTAGDLTLRDSRSLSVTGPVSAAGNVTLTAQSGAGTPSAPDGQAAGTLTLAGPVTAAGQATLTAFGNLTGASVSAPGQVTLVAGGDVQVTGISTATLTGTAGGAFTATGRFNAAASTVATGGALSLTDTAPLALTGTSSAGAAATIVAPTVVSTGSLTAAGPIDLQVAGDMSQSAGTIATQGQLTIEAASIHQTGGVLAGQGGAVLHAAGDVLQTGGGLAGSPLQIISDTGTSSFGATRTATVNFVPGTTNLAFKVLPVFTAPVTSVAFGAPPATVRIDASTITIPNPISAGVVELHSLFDTTQTSAGIITTRRLTGTAGYARGEGLTYDTPTQTGSAVLTAQNAITTLGAYYAGGDVRVGSAVPLTVTGQVVAGGARTIALASPALVVSAIGSLQFGALQHGVFGGTTPSPVLIPGGPATATSYPTVDLQTDSLRLLAPVTAPGGVVAISPLTPGLALSLDATQADVPGQIMSLTQATLSQISLLGDAGGPRRLQLGQSAAATGPSAGRITITAPLTLTNQAATLGLYAQGTVTESGAGGISIGRAATDAAAVVGTITGASGGATTLGALTDTVPANHFDVLGPFTAGSGLTISDTPDANAGRTGLLLSGTISSGTGDLGVLSVGQLGRGGTIAIGSAITPATLNAIDGNGAGHIVTLLAQNGAATGPAITEAPGSIINAGTLTGRASTTDLSAVGYDVLLENGTNHVAQLSDFIVGTGSASTGTAVVQAQGALRLVNADALQVTGQVTAKSVKITAASMTVSGKIGACAIGPNTGDVTLTALGGVLVQGAVGGQTSVTLVADTTVTGSVNAPAIGVSGTLFVNSGHVIGTTVTVAGGVTVSGELRAARLAAPSILFNGGMLSSDGSLAVTAGPAISGTVTSGGSLSVQSGGSITSSADLFANGGLTVQAAQNFVQTGGTIGSAQGVGINAGGLITQNLGAAILAGGTLRLTAGGGGSTLAGTLSGEPVQVIAPGTTLSLTPGGLMGRAAVSVGASTLTFGCPGCDTGTPGATVLVTDAPGARRPAGLRADAGDLTLGTIAADVIELHATGSITQRPGATLTAATLNASAGYGASGTDPAGLPAYAMNTTGTGSLILGTPGNNVLTLGSIQARSGFTLADTPGAQTDSTGATLTATGLSIGQTVRAGLPTDVFTGAPSDPPGAPLAITVAGSQGNLTLGAGAVLAGGNVTLTLPGALNETAGATLVARSLSGASASATLTSANQIARLGPFTTTGNTTLTDAANLQITGNVQAKTLTLKTGGTLDLNGGNLVAGTVALTAGGAVTESAGGIVADTLSVTASLLSAPSSQNAIATLSSVTAPGGVTVVNGRSLVTGPVTASAGVVSLQIAGDLAVSGPVSAGGAVGLSATGGLTVAAAAPITGASFTSQSGGATSLAGTIATTGGQVIAGNGLTLGGSLVSQGGGVTLDAGARSLALNGAVTSSGALSGRAGGAVSLTGQISAAAIGLNAGTGLTLGAGSVTAAGTTMQLNAGTAATLAGQATAPRLVVTAPVIMLQGGQLLVGGVTQAARSVVGLPVVGDGTGGVFFEVGSSLLQTGTTQIRASAAQATVRIDLTSQAGSVGFSSLDAPSSNLILNLGSGTASGAVRLNNLSVLYSIAQLGSAALTGTVAGQTGVAAAGVSSIGPRPDKHFQINNCDISSVNCILPQPQAVPVTNPLKELRLSFLSNPLKELSLSFLSNPQKELSLSFFREQDDDPDLLVPNITEQGL